MAHSFVRDQRRRMPSLPRIVQQYDHKFKIMDIYGRHSSFVSARFEDLRNVFLDGQSGEVYSPARWMLFKSNKYHRSTETLLSKVVESFLYIYNE